MIDGRAPLLIEVKSPGRRVAALSGAVARALDAYIGPVAVMSFNPAVPRWFARHRPEVLRGLVVTEEGKPERGRLKRRLSLWWSRADFLAYDIRDLPSRFRRQRAGCRSATWTVRSEAQRATALEHADQIIYERAAMSGEPIVARIAPGVAGDPRRGLGPLRRAGRSVPQPRLPFRAGGIGQRHGRRPAGSRADR